MRRLILATVRCFSSGHIVTFSVQRFSVTLLKGLQGIPFGDLSLPAIIATTDVLLKSCNKLLLQHLKPFAALFTASHLVPRYVAIVSECQLMNQKVIVSTVPVGLQRRMCVREGPESFKSEVLLTLRGYLRVPQGFWV
jgi:hypothetical protein